MKMASAQIDRFVVAAATAAAVVLQPASSWAATAAELPWDQPLDTLQQTLVGPVAHALITMSFIGAVFVYAIAGDSDIARRFAQDSARRQRGTGRAPADELSGSLSPASL